MSSDAASEAPTDSGVRDGEATPVSAPHAPPATEAPASPSSSAEAKMQSAQAALVALLDSDTGDAEAGQGEAPPSLRAVQKMCMRLPHLSNELTAARRCRLYQLLLLDSASGDGEGDAAAAAATARLDWTSFTSRALEAHVKVAQQAAAILPASLQITCDELAGLFYHLGAETAFYFNPEMVDVILCFTHVVAGSRATDKAVVLHTLYRLLCVLQKDFIVSTASRLYEPATTSLLRLMLQFYDPALATHMDQQQVDIGRYLLDWTRRLLVLQSDYETALKVLDWVFILGDPVMIPYVAHAYLITHRQTLLALETRQALTEHLDTMKFALPSSKAAAVDPKLVDGRVTAPTPVWSGKSLLQNADLLYRATPLSAQRMLDFCLYPDVGTLNKTPEDLRQYYANTPCLPLERSDLAAAFAKRRGGGQGGEAEELPTREYIIVDCRSKESYEYVRLPTAVLVGDVLSYQQEELATAMERLESCRGRALALFGTGRPIVEEMNLLKVLALYMVTRKRFPFVCIVPGGFKTTIPLVRSGVIDAVMSPSAATALANATVRRSAGGGIDWGQQASDTASTITAALSGVSGYLSQVEGAEVRHRAEELGARAKEGVAAAGSWGWGVMQRLRDGLSETREHAASALTSVASKVSSAQAGATAATAASGAAGPASATVAPASGASPAAASAGPAHIPTATAHPAASAAPAASQQIFSLGEDGEEDDLDLITSIPTRPMRGTVVVEPVAAAAAATPAAPAAPAGAASTPDRRPAASAAAVGGAAVSAAASPEPRAPPSPPPVPAAAPAAGASPAPPPPLTTATAARKASASQIAANIDAEFDELFGDLNAPPTTAPRQASTKAAAPVDAGDLFGA